MSNFYLNSYLRQLEKESEERMLMERYKQIAANQKPAKCYHEKNPNPSWYLENNMKCVCKE